MGPAWIHTARKPVGSGSLARSAAEHSPSVGQMNASPYINANVRSPLSEQQDVVTPLNVRPKSNSSLTSEEFYDTEQPALPSEGDSKSIASQSRPSLRLSDMERKAGPFQSGEEGTRSAQTETSSPQPRPDSGSVADLSRSASALTTTTMATQTPSIAGNQQPAYHNWYDYQNGAEYNAYLPSTGTETYGQAYAQYPQDYQNQEAAQQYDLYQQYQYQQAYGYDPYQMYGYPQHSESQTEIGMPSNLHPATSSSTAETDQASRSHEPSNASSLSISNPAYASTYSAQGPYANYHSTSSFNAQDSAVDVSSGSGSNSQLPWLPASSMTQQANSRKPENFVAKQSEVQPGTIYSSAPIATSHPSMPRAPPLELNKLNRHSNPDLSPRSSIVVNTPTSVISQPLHTRYESPKSRNGSDRSVGRISNPPSSTSNLSQTGAKRSSREVAEPSQKPPQVDPQEQKDANLGIGVGSAYVHRMRADAGETHISRQPMTLPVGLRRTAKSAPMTVKPEFLRRAIDIRYTHLPQRMLEKEVDDDDDDQDDTGVRHDPHVHQLSSERPSVTESLDSPRDSAISHRSSSPVDSIIEQTGKIKLFVANPGND